MKRYALSLTVILLGLALWASTGLFDFARAKAEALPCGTFCMDGTGWNGDDTNAIVAVCGSRYNGVWSPKCPAEIPGCTSCLYCCVGCPIPAGAPAGANGCWEPPKCGLAFNAPTLGALSQSPRFPLTVGQRKDSKVTLRFTAQAGADQNCPGQSAEITSVRVESVTLSAESEQWIVTKLARTYRGAKVKGNYPIVPATAATGLGTDSVSVQSEFSPYDPGFYIVEVRVIQSDGQEFKKEYRVPVYLLGSTRIR